MADSFLCAKFESGLSESFVERWRKFTVKVKVTILLVNRRLYRANDSIHKEDKEKDFWTYLYQNVKKM